jgi:hypothetical protein
VKARVGGCSDAGAPAKDGVISAGKSEKGRITAADGTLIWGDDPSTVLP